MREIAQRDRIFIKVSEVMQVTDNKPVVDPVEYEPTLDYLFDTFGEDKLVFGRYWPNGSAVDNLAAIIAIAQEYFEKKSRTVAEKEFWKNSTAAYKWVHRSASRPVG
jgi:predicted TIM-barrel fold metal-dependent hydrolase